MRNGPIKLAVVCLIIILCSRGAEGAEQTLVFYMHDIVTGPNQTAKPVITPSGSTNNLGFGAMTVIDDALTESADPSSNVIGRGQGMYITAAQDGSNFLLVFTAVLSSPEYNKSTINLQGADRIVQTQRDVSVVGGTGLFKFAQGYATIETVNFSGGLNVVLKFTVFLRYDNNSTTSSNGTIDSNTPSSTSNGTIVSGTPSSTNSPSATSNGEALSPHRLSIWSIFVICFPLLFCTDFCLW